MYKPIEVKRLKEDIIKEVTKGVPIDVIDRNKSLPSKATINKWLNNDTHFLNEYTRAKEHDFKLKCYEMFDIIDSCSLDKEAIMKAREQVQIRQWALARMMPKKWSLGAANQTNVQINVSPVTGMSIVNELEDVDTAVENTDHKPAD